MKKQICRIFALVLSVMIMTGMGSSFAEDIPDAAPVEETVENVMSIEDAAVPVEEVIADAPEVIESETETVQAKASVKTIKVTKNTSASLKVLDQRQITVASGKKIKSCSSSKKSIVTVNKTGLLTVKGEGTAKITIKLTNGKKYTLTVKATWTAPKSIKVTYEGNTSLKVKETLQLTATIKPANANPKVTWSSSNKKVAEVSSKGLVTAKKSGTCTLTAKTANGKKATVKIKVTAGEKELSSYYGKDLEKLTAVVGNGKIDESSTNFWYSTDGIVCCMFDEETNLVRIIYVEGPGYSVYGVSCGMDVEAARNKLMSAGFEESEDHLVDDDGNIGGYDYWKCINEEEEDWICVGICVSKNKKITEIAFGIRGFLD